MLPEQRVLADEYADHIQYIVSELEKVPITKEMGMQIAHFDGATLQLAAPLGPNVNDKMTAFGGSLASVSLLTGWSWVVLMLKQHSANSADVVIAEATLKFFLPVKSGFYTEVSAGSGHSEEKEKGTGFQKFLRFYKKKGRAKLDLKVSVFDEDNRHVMLMSGCYAATSRQ